MFKHGEPQTEMKNYNVNIVVKLKSNYLNIIPSETESHTMIMNSLHKAGNRAENLCRKNT